MIDALGLQKAIQVAHGRAQRLYRLRALLAVAFSVAGVIGGVVTEQETSDGYVALGVAAIIGPLAVSAFLAAVEGGAVARAAAIQERFDHLRFDLRRSAFDVVEVSDVEVEELAEAWSGDEALLSNWYPDVSALGSDVGAMFLQRMNLRWDTELRRNYARWAAWAGLGWTLLGVLVAAGSGWSPAEYLIRWFGPSAVLIQLSIETWDRHRRLASEKESLDALATGLLDSTDTARPDHDDVEALQSRVHQLRRRSPRLPEWFQDRHRHRLWSDSMSDLALLEHHWN